jgi:amino acid transporter
MALARKLGLIEAVSLSLSIIAPTMAMAFNVTLAAQAAGSAAPLAFAIGTAVLAVVGLSFVSFARRMAHAGSAYAYIRASFGPRVGFLAGWLLLLTYLTFCSATAAMVGRFADEVLENYGLALPGMWFVLAVAAVLLAMLFAYRDMRLATRLMLWLEGASVLAILVLGIIVLSTLGAAGKLSLAPFHPTASAAGWSGVGFALVYTVLSFAGFEGATTLGEETQDPHRDIPIAVLGTVLLAGAFYVLIAYVQVMGFGLDRMADLAKSDAPLNELALRFASRSFATLIDVTASVSAFACALGSLAAAARMSFALGRSGVAPALGAAHAVHGTPHRAVLVCGGIVLAGLVLWGAAVGAGDYYGYLGTIGTLALILVYLGVTLAEAVSAGRRARVGWSALGMAGAVLLLWPLGNSLFPVPDPPYNLFPYVVLGWVALGVVVAWLRPLGADASVREQVSPIVAGE